MKLVELLKNIEVKQIVGNVENIEITAIYDHSEKVGANGLFVATTGLRVDSHNFIDQAVKNGAVAVVVEKLTNTTLPQILVENSKIALSKIAGNLYKNVLEKLKIISVIGTNGKTTTTYFIKDMLQFLGFNVGVIGTSGIFINNEKLPAKLTTPDTLDLFLLFEKMQKAGVEVVVMEISAHAIFLHKIDGFLSEVAVFTNFSQDHLDFFKTMECYGAVKKSYFNANFCKNAVVNIDDKLGQEIFNIANIPALSYSLHNKKAHLFITKPTLKINESTFYLHFNNLTKKINFQIGAKYNIYNLLASVLTLTYFNIPFLKIINSISHIKTPEGRFKSVIVDKNCTVIIDYAHTIEALKQLLLHTKKTNNCKVICVFGCPGSREHLKRAKMAQIAGKFSGFVILTTDNPDIENPNIILSQMERGIKKTKCPYQIIEDRTIAIKKALNIKKNDEKTTILIVGKGQEPYQIINGVYVPYNDEEELLKIIKKEKNNG